VEATIYHTPVLLQETVSFLLTSPDGVYVDCTLGGGGHAASVVQKLRRGRIIGFDRDAEAIQAARIRLRDYGSSFEPVHAPFSDLREQLMERHITAVDGILLDLGVSSHHIDEPDRGFSFQKAGPLDMRMDNRSGMSAADVVNTYTEKELASVLWNYGEERDANRIAKAIVRSRPFGTTEELSACVRSIVRQPATTKALARVFQGIRIEVNKELEELHTVLADVPKLLVRGGRIVVLTYHSLEDRIVKDFFKARSAKKDETISKFLPERPLSPDLRIVNRKPVIASDREQSKNPRSRSAKLRAAERI
jgi:16S rRNA (cytosine1402-N4)-methyltransferase